MTSRSLNSAWSMRMGRGALAVLLIVLAAILGVLYRLATAQGRHSYDRGAAVSTEYQLTGGSTYELSTTGGIAALLAAGRDPTRPSCSIAYTGSAPVQLAVAAQSVDSRATHVVGTFVAPTGGRAGVTCTGWGAIFVDDADSSSFDAAGFFLTATTVVLVLGVGLGLSWVHAEVGRRIAEHEQAADQPD